MSYIIDASIYELRGSLSKFLRALARGDADSVLISRYGRPYALLVPLGNRDKPALEPQTKEDLAMRRRARWRDSGISRRVPPKAF